MSETVHEKKVYSLLDVLESIRRTLDQRYGSPFWVKAEMNKLNHYVHSGHCYPELLEKREGKIVAQIRSNLWKEDYLRINDNFLRVLKEPLKDGISILFYARISFDPVYGLALRILEIDPVYSLGELEREKQETIDRLHKEGIFETNKQFHLALVPQRIAVISVETSKGFADFRKMIETNSWGYRFFFMLFPSLLQGEKVAESIGRQLERINLVKHHFDAVAIIRGGGGDIGLAGYNRYELARQIALFPLPVITGIGHATNETVTEMVSFRNCITPTDLAGFLIQQFHNFSVPVKEARRIISEEALQFLSDSAKELKETALDLRNTTRNFLMASGRQLIHQATGLRGFTGFFIRGNREHLSREYLTLRNGILRISLSRKELLADRVTSVRQHAIRFIKENQTTVSHLDKQIHLLDPKRVLSRGYSITMHKGRAVRKATEITPGDTLKTRTFEGEIISTATEIKSRSSHE
jgi:exodeoxyribonuclease VII large subunit